MLRFKGLRISRDAYGFTTVVPLYYSKRGGTQAANHLKMKSLDRRTAVKDVLSALIARRDVAE